MHSIHDLGGMYGFGPIVYECKIARKVDPGSHTCPFRKLDPSVLMVKSAQNVGRNDGSAVLDRPTFRRVFAKVEVGPRDIIIV